MRKKELRETLCSLLACLLSAWSVHAESILCRRKREREKETEKQQARKKERKTDRRDRERVDMQEEG